MKKLISAVLSAAVMMSTTVFASVIPDHRGTNLGLFSIGTSKLNSTVRGYSEIFQTAGNQFGIDPNILAAICMQESGGVNYKTGPAWGIMQIEYTNEKGFASFGLDQTGTAWTLEDRCDPEKAVPYAAYLLSESLYNYDGDYAKMLQAYNFGPYTLNKIINAVGDDWLNERSNAKSYVANWPYQSYGDALYIEHVLRYYHHDIYYSGARVRVNDKLVKFSNQHPLVIDNTTLIPVRSLSEFLGADVSWDGVRQLVTVKKSGMKIDLYIDSETAYINDVPTHINVPAEVINNRTMVPIRFIAEAFDFDVNWNQDCCTVEITY